MSRRQVVTALLAAFMAASVSASAASAQPYDTEAQVDAIAGELMCECGAAVTVADCGNGTIASGMRDIIRQQVALGKSKGEILDHFAGLYGECILAEPRKSGIGLAAWLGPLVAIVAGGAVLGGSVWAWTLRASGSRRDRRPAPRPSGEQELDEYERRVEEELKRFE